MTAADGRDSKDVSLFSHLPAYARKVPATFSEELHPAVVRLGLKFAHGTINGSNARAVALLTAFKELIASYRTPRNKVLNRDLDKRVKKATAFLIDCRPFARDDASATTPSMGNAIKYVKMVRFLLHCHSLLLVATFIIES